MSENNLCCCKRTDARECLLTRYIGTPGPLDDDDICECLCHWQNNEYPEDFDSDDDY